MFRGMVAAQLAANAGSTPNGAMLATIPPIVNRTPAALLQSQVPLPAAEPPAAVALPLPPAPAPAPPQSTQMEGAEQPAEPLEMAAIPRRVGELDSRESAVALLARAMQERETHSDSLCTGGLPREEGRQDCETGATRG